MAAITYQDWSGGLDRRLPISVQEANRLWSLKDAYITQGKRISKRPGLKLITNGLAGSYGLQAINDRLKVFVNTGDAFTPPVVSGLGIDSVSLDKPAALGIDRIYYADLYQNFVFVVARYTDGTTRYHYLDAKSSAVTITIAVPGVVTWTAHGLLANDEITFSTTGALPTGLTAGTKYYVLAPAANTFTLSATPGGAAITTTGTQSGVHTALVPTYISDSNCPNTIGTTKAASRIFAPSANGQTVRYCKAGGIRDWTTASDAGFLPVALQQDTKSSCTACGTFQDSLVALFPDSAQIWTVAVDPSANAISKRMYGVGTREPLTIASFFSDLVFLSPFGFRSMTVQAQTNRIDDNDVGVPIDKLVVPDIASVAALTDPDKTIGVWIRELGQYWAIMDMGSYSKVWAYTVSKTSKIACWSEYTLPVKIKAVTTSAGKVYLRTVDSLYEVSPTQYTDNGSLINVEIQMAFQDAKTPGVLKQIYGADYVTSGSPDISFKYDPRDLTKETVPQTITGDTRPGDVTPVEVCAPTIAPVFRHAKDEGFELDAASFFYNLLGTL